MSVIGLVMNLLLAGLLMAALGMGWRLNRRLTVLRDSHDGFEAAVRELNLAAARAEQGLADLRAATDEATDLLADRIEKGRALSAKLERLMDNPPLARARNLEEAAAAPPIDAMTERRLGALLAAAREARPERLSSARPIAREPVEPARFEAARFEPARPEGPLTGGAALRRLAERPAPRRHTLDDDLFDDDEPRALSQVRGARA